MITFERLAIEDFGPLRSGTLALERQGAVLIQGQNDDTTSADSNGVGKSHVFGALTWALWGQTVEGDKTDEVIRQGAKLARVVVRFRDEGATYELERTRQKGSTALRLDAVNDAGSPGETAHTMSGATLADTQAKVAQLMGMDYHTWRNTVLYGQGDIKRFADPATPDAERKAILKRILRLESIDKARKAIEAKSAAAIRAAENAGHQAAMEKVRLEGVGPTEPPAAEVAQLKAKRATLEKTLARKPRIEALLKGVDETLAESDAKRAALAAAEKKVAELEKALARLEAELEAVGKQEAAAFRAWQDFKPEPCPSCGAPANAERSKKRKAELEAAWEGFKVKRELDLEGKQKDLNAAWQEAMFAAEAAEAELADDGALREKRGALKAELEGIGKTRAEADSLDRQLQKLVDQAAKNKAAKAALEAKVKELALAEEKANSEADHARFWLQGFGNAGLPSHLMDGLMPALTERANHYLALLTDGDTRIVFDTETKLKSGESRDKFGVTFTGEVLDGTRPSGGQMKRGLIAAGLGLRAVQAAQEGAAVDLLLLDEVLDGLDATGRARVMDLITELRGEVGSVFIVSHDAGLSAMFERVVTVHKAGGASTLEVME